ncbi:MAG: ComK family protein [Erysipelotrichaceae bacterium]|nr:MAG: ComK family [Erysipelotrichaceae bacterium]TXT18247.1 MAG: ComK family protein [Erysipelotrichaceae bacterium]
MRHVNYLKYDSLNQITLIIGLENKRLFGKPLTLLETWANAYGLGASGSYAAFKKMLSVKQKIPILIDPFHQIYFFPTLSPQLSECYWINASQVQAIKSKELESIVNFKDGSSLVLGIGRRSLMKQVQRCQSMQRLIQQTHLNQGLTLLNLHP